MVQKNGERPIRVWDVPKIIFEELSRSFGVLAETEEQIFPRELRIWRELKLSTSISQQTVLCLRIFPKKNTGEMQRILHVWSGWNVINWKERKHNFHKFTRDSTFSITGYARTTATEKTDILHGSFFRKYRHITPGLIDLFSKILLCYGHTITDPRFKREKKDVAIKRKT